MSVHAHGQQQQQPEGGARQQQQQQQPEGVATTEQLSEFVSRQVSAGVVDFAVGQPAPALLPLEAIRQAAAHRLGAEAQSTLLLQYGPAAGYKGFRQALARFLSAGYGYQVQADELMATAGVSHGLDLCVRHLLPDVPIPTGSTSDDAGTTIAAPATLSEVFVECPTYFLAQRIFDQNRFVTHHVPTSASEGMDVDALERLLQAGASTRQQWRTRLVYTIPAHNNPRGTTLSVARRRHLIQLAHDHDLLLVADEVYQLLTFPPWRKEGREGPEEREGVPRPLRWIERDMGLGAPGQSRVVSLSSFSKLTAPGLRLGWVEADPALLARIKRDGSTASGGCMSALQTGIVHSALELGLVEAHLRGVVLPTLEANCRALCQALRSELPHLAWHQPQGGYFVFLELPPGVDAGRLLLQAEQHHAVRFTPGNLCGPGLHGHVRLCFAFYTAAELRLGVQRLAQAIRAYTD